MQATRRQFSSMLMLGMVTPLSAAPARNRASGFAPSQMQGDLLLSGGPIITMAGDQPETVEAVLVRDGRIFATGSLVSLRQAARKDARSVDLGGRTLLPGFIDAHGHLGFVGKSAMMAQLHPPPIGNVSSIKDLQEALRAYHPPVGMSAIVGIGYDDSQLAEGRHPTRADLDAVSADRPIVLLHASGHLAAMNSAMLRLVGYHRDSANPVGGVIRREADGRTPNGVIEEAALYPVLKQFTPSTLDAAVAPLIHGAKIYAENGITTANDGRVMPEDWPALEEVARRGALPIDVTALLAFEREWPASVRQRIGKGYEGRLRVAGVKLALDGSPQGRTAWLKEPVTIPLPGQAHGYSGYPAIDLELFGRKLAEASANNFQVFVHVNGDAAIEELIAGVRANGLAGKRTIAVHSQVVQHGQLAAMKALDIQPSFFAAHTYFWGDWHREVALGAARADFISPQATAWSVGLRPSAHSDAPVVPPNIMRLVWSSVNRRTRSGDILGPTERISPYQALKQVTINAAWQLKEDLLKGSIEKGKIADFVILDGNPLDVDRQEICNIKVSATIKDGQFIFGE